MEKNAKTQNQNLTGVENIKSQIHSKLLTITSQLEKCSEPTCHTVEQQLNAIIGIINIEQQSPSNFQVIKQLPPNKLSSINPTTTF
jgi:uncharacterized FlaG/YvyC family protein